MARPLPDEELVPTQSRLPRTARAKLDEYCRSNAVSRNLVINRALEEFFERRERQPTPFEWGATSR